MTYPDDFKAMVIALRAKGKTYQEINKLTDRVVPKSTVSYWCKDVVLPKFYYDKIIRLNDKNRARGRKMAIAHRKSEVRGLIDKLRDENEHLVRELTHEPSIQKVVLAVLYYCEGNKWKSHRGLMLGSSDPYLLTLYIKLLKSVYSIEKLSLRARVSYRADQDIGRLEHYWSRLIGIPLKNFYETKPDMRTVGKPTKIPGYKGVCVISCAGAKIQLELEQIVIMLSSFRGRIR